MKQFFAIIVFLSAVFFANAQDLIIMRDGSWIEARITEISPTEIRYRRFDHLDGPIIVLPAANILSIRYENGMVQIINTAPAPQVAAVSDQQDRFMSGSVGFMGGIAVGINYERKFNRVSRGVDIMGAFGSDFLAFAGAATFKFFPAPIFFFGADLGLSYLGGAGRSSSFGGQFAPQLGFRIGGQNSAFFTDIFFAAPMHIGSGGFDINVRPGTRVGGAW